MKYVPLFHEGAVMNCPFRLARSPVQKVNGSCCTKQFECRIELALTSSAFPQRGKVKRADGSRRIHHHTRSEKGKENLHTFSENYLVPYGFGFTDIEPHNGENNEGQSEGVIKGINGGMHKK